MLYLGRILIGYPPRSISVPSIKIKTNFPFQNSDVFIAYRNTHKLHHFQINKLMIALDVRNINSHSISYLNFNARFKAYYKVVIIHRNILDDLPYKGIII